MEDQPDDIIANETGWNYFTYYTEIEEHFQRARGSSLFLLSPMDWALIETWKNAGVPLEAVLRGIDTAFEKWHSRKQKAREVNSLAYCAQAVFEEGRNMVAASDTTQPSKSIDAPFTLADLSKHLGNCLAAIGNRPGLEEIASQLHAIAREPERFYASLEDLEQRLTALEEKLAAHARLAASAESLLQVRKELDSYLKPYRSKMSAEQIAWLEKQFVDKRVLEEAKLPRLSLFYMQLD